MFAEGEIFESERTGIGDQGRFDHGGIGREVNAIVRDRVALQRVSDGALINECRESVRTPTQA